MLYSQRSHFVLNKEPRHLEIMSGSIQHSLWVDNAKGHLQYEKSQGCGQVHRSGRGNQHVIGKRKSKQSRHDDLESEYTGAMLVTVKKDGCNRIRGMQ